MPPPPFSCVTTATGRCDRARTSSPWRAELIDAVPLNDGLGSQRLYVSLFANASLPCTKGLAKLEININNPAAVNYFRGSFKVSMPQGDMRLLVWSFLLMCT
eukprot:362435-Chlamydomonas_euryale.AAC.3